MSLHLDARQRAMLLEMGVTVWAPPEAAPAPSRTLPEGAPASHALPAASEARPRAGSVPEQPAQHTPPPPAAARARPAAAPPADTPVPGPSVAAGGSATPLKLHAAQLLYPDVNPAQTPGGLGAGWLIVAESMTPAEPLTGDAGRLLDNMLRAMQLHRHPRVYMAALERSAAPPAAAHEVPAALADMVAALQPAMVLVLGHVAARAALGRTEPLGRLRAGPHQLAGCPAVVTYDPAFLLRSQETKAAAWADLCHALAMVRRATQQG